MEYLLSADAQEMFSDPSMAGFIPVVKGLELQDPMQIQAVEAFSKGTPLPVIPEMSAYWEPLNFALQSVVEFDVNPVDALSAAEAAIAGKLSEMRQE
jgi:maltose-binding protein MalE